MRSRSSVSSMTAGQRPVHRHLHTPRVRHLMIEAHRADTITIVDLRRVPEGVPRTCGESAAAPHTGASPGGNGVRPQDVSHVSPGSSQRRPRLELSASGGTVIGSMAIAPGGEKLPVDVPSRKVRADVDLEVGEVPVGRQLEGAPSGAWSKWRFRMSTVRSRPSPWFRSTPAIGRPAEDRRCCRRLVALWRK